MLRIKTYLVFFFLLCLVTPVFSQSSTKKPWQYAPEGLRPFWQGDRVEGESVLFIKDGKTAEARASVLFLIRKVLAVRNSAGDVTYENGKDYSFQSGSREIVLP